jgi:hypothetical protein
MQVFLNWVSVVRLGKALVQVVHSVRSAGVTAVVHASRTTGSTGMAVQPRGGTSPVVHRDGSRSAKEAYLTWNTGARKSEPAHIILA